MTEGFDVAFGEEKTELPVEKPETTGGQPRDESGKFAPKQADAPAAAAAPVPAPEITPAAPVAPAEPPKAEPGHVPISALLDEREKRQRFERELNDLRSRQSQQPEQSPSLQTPEEIQAYVQREAANSAWTAKAEISENLAREKHTDAIVDAAIQWSEARCAAEKASLGFSPFAVEQMRQRHPVDWLVRQHQHDAFVRDIGDDPEAYRARIRAEIAAEATAQPATGALAPALHQPVAPKPTPRPSLASAPTAGGIQSVPVVAPFEATFK